MKEREFLNKSRELFENLRGHTDCLILRIYYRLDDEGNVILDIDNLKEDFKEKVEELEEMTK